ncbi:hypothetical protein BBK14_11380 [Parafrankia soli]|uniref:Uncharacterized protein n=1 Tax=Parafrankia soli TaxID=2599596 RepID=A0A1S1R9M6_9ACTN|nr:hypothetical protein [Parafrankia soli]OHV42215.1 hypothetical protein BBK14_11380 [Parafrankia soli]
MTAVAPGSTPAERQTLADATWAREQIHAGRPELVWGLVSALARDETGRRRLCGLVAVLAAAVPATDIRVLVGWVGGA